MNAEDSIRYLAHEAKRCRNKDTSEALCLLFPAVLRCLSLKPMDDFQADAFHLSFREELARVESVPLTEAHCDQCGHADAVRADLFTGPAARWWCDFCGREMWFTRQGVAV